MSESGDELSEVPHPPFVFAGVRCALEMVLVASLVLLLGLPAQNAIYLAVVVLLAVVGMVVVLFWCLNQQMDRWIKHAQGKPTVDRGGWF